MKAVNLGSQLSATPSHLMLRLTGLFYLIMKDTHNIVVRNITGKFGRLLKAKKHGTRQTQTDD